MTTQNQEGTIVSSIADWIGIVSFLWAVISSFYVYYLQSKYKRAQKSLIESIQNLQRQLEEKELALEECSRFDPREWPKQVDNADIVRGTESALEAAFERLAPLLSRSAGALASAYGDSLHILGLNGFEKALRYSRIDILLQKTTSERQELLDELESIHVIHQAGHGHYIPDEQLLSSSRDDDVDYKIAEHYVQWLASMGRRYALINSRIFELLLRRARRISMSKLGNQNTLTLIARQLWAESMIFVGNNEESIDELEAILPIAKQVFGPRNQRIFDIYLMIQQSLIGLGRYDEAQELDRKLERLAKRIDEASRQNPEPMNLKIMDSLMIKEWIQQRRQKQEP